LVHRLSVKTKSYRTERKWFKNKEPDQVKDVYPKALAVFLRVLGPVFKDMPVDNQVVRMSVSMINFYTDRIIHYK
jgi:hypothetical protein